MQGHMNVRFVKSNVFGFLMPSSVVFVPAVYGIQKVPNWKQELSSLAVGYQVGLWEYGSQSWRCGAYNTRMLLTLQLLPSFWHYFMFRISGYRYCSHSMLCCVSRMRHIGTVPQKWIQRWVSATELNYSASMKCKSLPNSHYRIAF